MCSLEKRGNIFLLTLTGDGVDEHRLNSTLIFSIRTALLDAKFHSTRGSVFITISQGKFFCNGFDINNNNYNNNNNDNNNTVLQLSEPFKRLVSDFMSLPMPTIAVVTGHAAGAGLGLAICHDYVFMTRNHGVMCMNEIDIGVLSPDYGFELIIAKVVNPGSLRDIMLRGVKVKADQAVTMGLVDVVYEDRESAVEGGLRMGEELAKKKWDGALYAEIRKGLYPRLCGMVGLGFKPRL